MLHPILQLDQFALQAEQLLEINPPVDGFPGAVAGELVGEGVEAIIVDLKLELLVETVQHLGLDALVDRSLGGLLGHGSLGLAQIAPRYFQTRMSPV
jgi:hypothetical protein